MDRCQEPSWFRTSLLLLALAAGGVATQLVPPYQEIAFAPQHQAKAASADKSSHTNTRGLTGIDVNSHYLGFIESIG
jgi:hypothetical protein